MNGLRFLGGVLALAAVVRVLWVVITTRDAHEASQRVSSSTLNEIRARDER